MIKFLPRHIRLIEEHTKQLCAYLQRQYTNDLISRHGEYPDYEKMTNDIMTIIGDNILDDYIELFKGDEDVSGYEYVTFVKMIEDITDEDD